MFARQVSTRILFAAVALSAALAQAGGSRAEKAAALNQSAVSAQQAVAAAVKQVAGRATDVSFEYARGNPHYEVRILAANGAKHEVRVAAADGRVIDSRPDHEHDDDDAHTPSVSLEQAMKAAVAKTGGKVKDAEFDRERGRNVYKVETVTGNRHHEVRVDASNGKVLSSRIDY